MIDLEGWSCSAKKIAHQESFKAYDVHDRSTGCVSIEHNIFVTNMYATQKLPHSTAHLMKHKTKSILGPKKPETRRAFPIPIMQLASSLYAADRMAYTQTLLCETGCTRKICGLFQRYLKFFRVSKPPYYLHSGTGRLLFVMNIELELKRILATQPEPNVSRFAW